MKQEEENGEYRWERERKTRQRTQNRSPRKKKDSKKKKTLQNYIHADWSSLRTLSRPPSSIIIIHFTHLKTVDKDEAEVQHNSLPPMPRLKRLVFSCYPFSSSASSVPLISLLTSRHSSSCSPQQTRKSKGVEVKEPMILEKRNTCIHFLSFTFLAPYLSLLLTSFFLSSIFIYVKLPFTSSSFTILFFLPVSYYLLPFHFIFFHCYNLSPSLFSTILFFHLHHPLQQSSFSIFTSASINIVLSSIFTFSSFTTVIIFHLHFSSQYYYPLPHINFFILYNRQHILSLSQPSLISSSPTY